jgi:hypothetical protein
MRTITAPTPATFSRELVQQLSRAAVLVDKCDATPPETPSDRAHLARLHELESQARRKLKRLRETLERLPLD